MTGDIPVSIIIVTKNEAANLPRCLSALQNFKDIWVVDSGSNDGTDYIARSYGTQFIDFRWNGLYPKKRQWCLDNLPIKHDFVFFVDADEEVTPELVQEISRLDFLRAGYFVKGRYVVKGKPLKYGLKNKKLCLIDKRKMMFPMVEDLAIEGMGEIEGHYQPVMRKGAYGSIGSLQSSLLHHAYDDFVRYKDRHQGYREWEEGIKKLTINDPVFYRRVMKSIFSVLPRRDIIAFAHSYIMLLGFLDGKAGWFHARCRYDYYTRHKKV